MSKTKTTQKYSYVGVNGFGGGLSSENPVIVDKNKMVIADNILIGTVLSRRKRGGQEKFHTGSFDQTASYPVSGSASGLPIRKIIEFWRTASLSGVPTSDVFLHQGTKVWSIDDRNTVGVDRTGVLTLSADSVPSYQVFQSNIYFLSTVTGDGYNKWNGETATAQSATAPPDGAGQMLTTHFGRMVMAGNVNFPFRVYLSAPLNAEDWTGITATSLDIEDDGDPEGITGIASFQNRLYVWTRTSLFEVTGNSPATFVVQRVSRGIGCVAHNSIVPIPNDVMFASDRGVHSLKQLEAGKQTETKFLSMDIQRLWTELLNSSLIKRLQGEYFSDINSVVYTVPSSGQSTNDQLLVYNIEFGTWTVWPDIDARSIGSFLISNKKNILLGKEDGSIALLNRTSRNDFGAGYLAKFKTAVLYPGGDLTVQKRFISITVLASTTTATQYSVSWSIDGVKNGSKVIDLSAGEDTLGSTFVLGQSILGIGQYVPKTASIEDIGYGIQIEVTCGGTGDIEVYGFILEVEDVNDQYA